MGSPVFVRSDPRLVVLILALALAAGLAWPRPAVAQWGLGGWGMGGWGMRGGGYLSNAATLRNLNARSSQAARFAYGTRSGLTPGPGGRDSSIHHTRDASFGERFQVSTRRSLGGELARRAATPGSAESPARGDGEPPRRVVPLAEFYSAAGVLAWPSAAPEDGPLASRRAAADAAISAVFREVRDGGRAPVALVADARAALVAYGQPALEALRVRGPASAVDGFHAFLLKLYDSLGEAALGSTARSD